MAYGLHFTVCESKKCLPRMGCFCGRGLEDLRKGKANKNREHQVSIETEIDKRDVSL